MPNLRHILNSTLTASNSFMMVTKSISELSTDHFSWTRPDPLKRFTRFDPTRDCRQKVWPDPTRGPTLPQYMYSLQLNNYIYLLVNYRWKSINPNLVFEDSHRFMYQEIISKKLKNPKCWPDPTRQNPAKSWPDPTRPDPTRPDPTRPAGPSDPWTTLIHIINEFEHENNLRITLRFQVLEKTWWRPTALFCIMIDSIHAVIGLTMLTTAYAEIHYIISLMCMRWELTYNALPCTSTIHRLQFASDVL